MSEKVSKIAVGCVQENLDEFMNRVPGVKGMHHITYDSVEDFIKDLGMEGDTLGKTIQPKTPTHITDALEKYHKDSPHPRANVSLCDDSVDDRLCGTRLIRAENRGVAGEEKIRPASKARRVSKDLPKFVRRLVNAGKAYNSNKRYCLYMTFYG